LIILKKVTEGSTSSHDELISIKRTESVATRLTHSVKPVRQMAKFKIPHNAVIFVGDGRKALFLCNEGNEGALNLRKNKVFEDTNPPTHEQGADRPGRVSKAYGSGRRSAVEATDWHDIEAHRFVGRIASAMEELVRLDHVPAFVIVAPPKALADLRSAIRPDVKALIVAEVNKDLTKHPIGEIEKNLAELAEG
jgi:protein required for attachment to host cells